MDSKLEKLDMLLHKTSAYTQFLSDKLTSSNVYRAAPKAPASSTSTTTPDKKRGRKTKTDTKDESKVRISWNCGFGEGGNTLIA
jgi:hypothetical protein